MQRYCKRQHQPPQRRCLKLLSPTGIKNRVAVSPCSKDCANQVSRIMRKLSLTKIEFEVEPQKKKPRHLPLFTSPQTKIFRQKERASFRHSNQACLRFFCSTCAEQTKDPTSNWALLKRSRSLCPSLVRLCGKSSVTSMYGLTQRIVQSVPGKHGCAEA